METYEASLKEFGIILLVGLFIGSLVTYMIMPTRDTEIPLCPICKTCQVCKTPELQTCETKTNTIYVPVPANEDKIRADIYLNLAKYKLSGYYDDYNKFRYESCTNKTRDSEDYLITAIGFYKIASLPIEQTAYERYLKAIQTIKAFCENKDRKEEDKEEVTYTYEWNYNRYHDYVINRNSTVVFNE